MSQRLQDARSSSAPKRRFAFKTKPIPAPSKNKESDDKYDNEASQAASMQHANGVSTLGATNITTSRRVNGYFEADFVLPDSKLPLRSRNIEISRRDSEWHIEPAPSDGASEQNSASIMNINGCIIDLSARATIGSPLAKTHIFAARRSLIICGHVSGSTFLSECEACIVVADCAQMRLHNCKNCLLYLHSTSNPVIEGCKEIKFAPLPAAFVSSSRNPSCLPADFSV